MYEKLEQKTVDFDLRQFHKQRRSIELTLETGSVWYSQSMRSKPTESVGLLDRSYHPAIGPFECRGQIEGPIGCVRAASFFVSPRI